MEPKYSLAEHPFIESANRMADRSLLYQTVHLTNRMAKDWLSSQTTLFQVAESLARRFQVRMAVFKYDNVWQINTADGERLDT